MGVNEKNRGRSQRDRGKFGCPGADDPQCAPFERQMGHSRLIHRRDLSPLLDLGALTLATLVAFAPVVHNGFVNWDDPTVIVENTQLSWPAVLPWAFQTTLIGHYQPLAWLTWAATKAAFGLSPSAFHAVSLAGHLLNAVLVYLVGRRFAEITGRSNGQGRFAALAAAFLFALHPAAVETVAWTSALPYALSLAALLTALLAYLDDRRMISLACYGLSLLIRVTALGLPVVLLLLDMYPLERYRRTRPTRLVVEKIPFAAVALAAALAEWHARDVATLQDVGIGARLTMAATAPFVYLGRTLAPLRLSPLDPLAISPTIDTGRLMLGAAAIVGVTGAAWLLRRRLPALLVGWLAYLLVLAPVIGLTPSGLQATADRYMYVPAVILALVVGAAAVQLAGRLRPASVPALAVAGIAIVAALGTITWRQTEYWTDSISLWTRAVELDPHDDIATYNLAIALAAAGREGEAMDEYEATLRLVPDHALARRNLSLLQAAHAERDADRLAAQGHLDEADALYARALALDAKRLHARAARGMLLMRRGRFGEAAPELRAAFDGGVQDGEVPNALAFVLLQGGDAPAAAAVLRRALADHPGSVNLEHNLARLLATAPDPRVRDGATALRLALDVCEKTGNGDPRALDTLAAAYAATGRLDLARATAERAAALARQSGDAATAAEIAAHAAGYRR